MRINKEKLNNIIQIIKKYLTKTKNNLIIFKNIVKEQTKQFYKWLFNTSIMQKIAMSVVYGYMHIVYKTSRIVINGHINELHDVLFDKNKSAIMLAWHGKVAILGTIFKQTFCEHLHIHKNIFILASKHRDGRLMATFIEMLGYKQIAGSTINKKRENAVERSGAVSSILTIIKEIKNGSIIFLAPDGPKGPANKINSKIVDIAKKYKTPLCPISVNYSFKYQFKTWDKFNFPFPFGRVNVFFEEPVYVDGDANVEEVDKILEERLNTEHNEK